MSFWTIVGTSLARKDVLNLKTDDVTVLDLYLLHRYEQLTIVLFDQSSACKLQRRHPNTISSA